MSSKIPPKVSIIIPFYKNSVYLEECVKHCLDLDYPNYEIIVVSNSPVRLPYEQVKIIITDKLGQVYKKDLGCAHASGEICAFVDDDAYPSKDWIKNAVKYFDEPDVVAAGGPGVTPPNDSLMQKAGGLIYSLPIGGGKFSYRYVARKMDKVDELPGFNLFVRRSFLKEIGGVNVKYRSGEDTILSHKIVRLGKKFKYASDVIVYHHRRPLFVPHLKQVSTYALHRGYFARKYSETSARLSYALPSIFLLGIMVWTVLSMLVQALRLPLIMLIAGYFSFSFVFALLSSKSIKVSSLTSVGVALTHLTYAIYFIKGFFTKELGERPSY